VTVPTGEKRNAYRIFVGKSEGKKSLERPRHRWVDNIKMDPREIEWDGTDWIAQDRNQWRALVNTVMNFRIPQNTGNFLSSFVISGFPRRARFHEVIPIFKASFGFNTCSVQ
jgi:hypothetical protein